MFFDIVSDCDDFYLCHNFFTTTFFDILPHTTITIAIPPIPTIPAIPANQLFLISTSRTATKNNRFYSFDKKTESKK